MTDQPIPTDQARERLDALIGRRVRATVAHIADSAPRFITGVLTTEIGLYAVEDATVRYPGATVHVDDRNLVSVEEDQEDTGPDEWDLSRAEYEADILRDRATDLKAENACLRGDRWKARREVSRLRDVLEAVSCADSIEEVSNALDRARDVTTPPTQGDHRE